MDRPVRVLAPPLAGALGAALLLATFGAWWCDDPAWVVRSIDHGEALFADFREFYLPRGERLLEGDLRPVPGSTLTPGMALAMAGLAATGLAWPLYVAATVAALLTTLSCTALLLDRAWQSAGSAPWPVGRSVGWGAGFLLAVPTLHALKWGQSSTFATAAALVAGVAATRHRSGVAAVAAGLAMVCKPWAVLVVFALPGWRARVGALAVGTAGALGLPALWFGPAGTLDLAYGLAADVDRMLEQFAVDPNSQSTLHVAQRYLRVPAGARAELDRWLLPVTQLLAVVWGVHVARRHAGRAVAVPLVLCGVPLLVPTAWPNDLQFVLPGLLVCCAAPAAGPGRVRVAVPGCVLLAAPWVWLLGWRWYGGLGLAATAVLCLAFAGRTQLRRVDGSDDRHSSGSGSGNARCTTASP